MDDRDKRKSKDPQAPADHTGAEAVVAEDVSTEEKITPADAAGAQEAGASEAEASDRQEVEPSEPAEEAPEPEPSEEDRLREQLAQLQARLRTVSKAYTDLQQEMRLFRERNETQLKLNMERQAFEAAKSFFEPVMNLKRSIHLHGDDMALFVEGLRMIEHQFMAAMERLGLEKVPGEGADFDPNFHEALAIQPVTDPALDGKVVQVHSDGYAVKGKVLQAAQVVIGKAQEPSGEA